MQNNNNALIAGIVAVVVATLMAATLVYIFAPDGTDVAPLIGLVGPTVAALAALGATMRTNKAVERVDKRTEDLSNGLMDAKVRAGVADVLPDHMIDPKAEQQLEADRQRRDQHADTQAEQAG